MIKKVKKKTCNKAKREKEILADLAVLSRRVFVLEEMSEANQEWDRAAKIQRELELVQARQRDLNRELANLWTEPGTKKKRARAKADRS